MQTVIKTMALEAVNFWHTRCWDTWLFRMCSMGSYIAFKFYYHANCFCCKVDSNMEAAKRKFRNYMKLLQQWASKLFYI
jgi:hypothetical protein